MEHLSNGVLSLLKNQGPFCTEDFDPSDESIEAFLDMKILCIGAGGLGCELLKSLALSGFRNIDVIDMDTIDPSNLNRQFLFRQGDVGKSKSEVAAAFINRRFPYINIKAHCCKIQDMDDNFYLQFDLVLGGLDSANARLWISEKLVDINKAYCKQIPYIDGGTERWLGHVKFIMPGSTACMTCQEVLFPKQKTYQFCTIASSPRSPEHCIAWAQEIQWPKERKGEKFDGDNDDHIQWVMQKAIEHGRQFGITEGFSPKLTKGVTKGIIPAIASTQSIIASWCTTEALKYLSCSGPVLDNNILYSGDIGIYYYRFSFDKNPKCPVCSTVIENLDYVQNETIQQLLNRIGELKGIDPNNSTIVKGEVAIYMGESSPALKGNLSKVVSDLIGPNEVFSIYDSTNDVSLQFVFE